MLISTLILYILYNIYYGEVLYCSDHDTNNTGICRPFSDTSYDFAGKVICAGDDKELVLVLDHYDTDTEPSPKITRDYILYSPQTIYTDSTLSEYDIANIKSKKVEPNVINHPYYSDINKDIINNTKKQVIIKVPEKSICDKIKSYIKSKFGFDDRIESIKMQKDLKRSMRHLDRVRNQKPIDHMINKGMRPIVTARSRRR